MSSKVIVHNLWKAYDRVDAVRGVSFEVASGEIFGFLGPNGAGKTTTIECVLGLRQPDRGVMEICGIDARKRPREMKQRIGAALQTTALQEKITPREALRLFASFYRERSEPEVLLDRFGLREYGDAAFETLSGGQRQRLALALAFVNRPDLVFLDEPTTGLDAQSRRELHEDIRRMKKEGRTVLLTTHYIEEAHELCDRVAIIHQGRIVANGSPRELIARSNAVPSVRLEIGERLPIRLFDGIEGIADLELHDTGARFRSEHVHHLVAELSARLERQGIDIDELHVQRATLEDVFIELTGSAALDQRSPVA